MRNISKHRFLKGLRISLLLRLGSLIACLLLCAVLSGCASLSNPIADGIPVDRLPAELLAKPKDGTQTIPLTLLGQEEPAVYRLGPGDALSVSVEGVTIGAIPPPPIAIVRGNRAFADGFPGAVRKDGTIQLPYIESLKVQGLSLSEASELIRKAYQEKKIIKPGNDRIFVTLNYPRQYHVTVFRQESGGKPTTAVEPPRVVDIKQGTGYRIDLPAYENDVLHALAQTGGLPGLDAINEIIVEHRGTEEDEPHADEKQVCSSHRHRIVRIPVRVHPEEPLPFTNEDMILRSGDVVSIRARTEDYFFTGGLLPGGAYLLPRDRDLTVIEAISFVKGPLINGAFATNVLVGNLIAPGIGGDSPSLLTVLRRTPDGRQVPIRIDLNEAMRDPRQQILVRSDDMLILQETPGGAIARFFTHDINFAFAYVGELIHSAHNSGAATLTSPAALTQVLNVGGR